MNEGAILQIAGRRVGVGPVRLVGEAQLRGLRLRVRSDDDCRRGLPAALGRTNESDGCGLCEPPIGRHRRAVGHCRSAWADRRVAGVALVDVVPGDFRPVLAGVAMVAAVPVGAE